ncbi:MAG: hypothetical protein NVSMB32_05220 [Actinomycetota bacterium]
MAHPAGLRGATDFIREASDAAKALLEAGRALAILAAPDPLGRPLALLPPDQRAGAIARYQAAARAVEPFVAQGPDVLAATRTEVAQVIRTEAPTGRGEGEANQLAGRLASLGAEPEAVQDVRGSYRLAVEIGANPDVRELVVNRAPMMALTHLAPRFPEVLVAIQRHTEAFGWVRSAWGGVEAATPKDLVQRLQMILLRWEPEHIRAAAEPLHTTSVEDVLGFAPSPALVERIATLRDLATLRSLRPAIFWQADAIAAGFWAVHGDEGRARKPGRMAPPAPVTGQTVSVGRALGRVRIMHGPMEVPALEMGDVLVTAASTPDKMGTESAFPQREGAPAGMERVAAIVADEGGLLSHAATISRELGIPCIVGTEAGTRTLKDGQMVEVDATREEGRVIALEP